MSIQAISLNRFLSRNSSPSLATLMTFHLKVLLKCRLTNPSSANITKYGYRGYPAETSAVVQKDGDCSSSFWIGEAKDVGKAFEIIAVVAHKNAQDTLNKYVKDSTNIGTWMGLENLPEDATEYDLHYVIRR